MTSQLVNVHSSVMIGGELVPAVDLRDLHQSLGSSQHFSDWASKRLREAQADEGADYVSHKIMANSKTGRPQLDYLVTLDLAKEIAMLERNQKGKAMRQYFIRVEKEFRVALAKPISRREQLLRDLAEIDLARTGSAIVDGIRPINTYGSKAPNGNRRLGLRRAAWVASRRSRLEDALVIHRELRDLDQAELALGWEGGPEA